MLRNKDINSGFGVVDFFVVLLLVFTLVVPIARIFPTYIEYHGLKKTINRIQKSSQTENEARSAIQSQFAIDSVKAINADDVIIETVNEKLVISFKYKQPIPLYGDLSLLMDYEAVAKGK
ncbi:MAG: hypothetical protein RLZZ210_1450 [Pseudomonadota bacterium]|jgi:hypothetical protein